MDENNKTPLEPTDEIQSESADETQPESADKPKKGSKIRKIIVSFLVIALIFYWGCNRIADDAVDFGFALICAAIASFLIELLVILPDGKVPNKNDDSINGKTFLGLIAFGLIVIAIVFFFQSCSESDGFDYYLDYNHNGKADKGEYAYHENKDGEIDFWY